jgi:hypothetical protein
LYLCRSSTGCRCMDFFLNFLFCSIDLCVTSYAKSMLFGWLWLCSAFWDQLLWCCQLCPFCSRFLWLFSVFCASIQSLEYFSISLKNEYLYYYDGDCIEFLNCVR